MCGHGIIAVVTIAIERGLIRRRAAGRRDRPRRARRSDPRPRDVVRGGGRPPASRSVSFINVPSFVLAAGVPVTIGARTMPVDVAFGGAFYAIVDAEQCGLADPA